MAEDYAFKASVSKAYEGYRKEAVKLDEEFAKRLFGSALTRLDELPSRFMSNDHHSTPLSELLDHPTIKDFIATVPDAGSKLISFLTEGKTIAVSAAGALAGAAAQGAKRKPSSASKAPNEDDEP